MRPNAWLGIMLLGVLVLIPSCSPPAMSEAEYRKQATTVLAESQVALGEHYERLHQRVVTPRSEWFKDLCWERLRLVAKLEPLLARFKELRSPSKFANSHRNAAAHFGRMMETLRREGEEFSTGSPAGIDPRYDVLVMNEVSVAMERLLRELGTSWEGLKR